jgi:hypothetical protein
MVTKIINQLTASHPGGAPQASNLGPPEQASQRRRATESKTYDA